MHRSETTALLLKTLLLSDLVGSTKLVETLGDKRTARLFRRHDRMARDLMREYRGREIDKTDGFLLLFERPMNAVDYALAYHAALAELSGDAGVELSSRVGIHLGEVAMRDNPAEDVAQGAKPLEVEGLAKPVAARLMSLAGGRQTLLSRGAFDLARRGAVGTRAEETPLRWLAHGGYRFQGVEEPLEVFEVGVVGFAPLEAPADSAKARRVASDAPPAVRQEPSPDEAPTPYLPAARPATPRSQERGRFFPGAQLGERYRIVELIGRGGMGEVYRAEDLKLGQAVALKLLPEDVEDDPERLERFLGEVRAARQVSHPNVCRVHDVGEAAGLHYLSMEYVDGEDLESLLRRIGRLPKDKAIEIARQLCAGLAAVHDQGLLHRDLKPANLMIDGRGRVRITDFGLAALAGEIQGRDVGSGTPAYMAPEQLAGAEVSVQSEIYALGLVLYELFTGRAPFAASSLAELMTRHESASPASPASLVEGLDPAVERVILSCLEKDPASRPGSVREVAAALPGGDPLAAALAAGETPSPELVAAAGEKAGLAPQIAWLCLIAVVLGVVLVISLASRTQLTGLTELESSPAALTQRAREIVHLAGYPEQPHDSAYGFVADRQYLAHLAADDLSPQRWSRLRDELSHGIRFWYRQSPRNLVSLNPHRLGVSTTDPPAVTPGMAGVVLDPRGRLRRFEAVPPERESPIGGRPVASDAELVLDVDWAPFFSAAGLDLADFEPFEPSWLPGVYADARAAWRGVIPDSAGTPIEVRGAAYRGQPVAFQMVAPWEMPGRARRASAGSWVFTFQNFWFYASLLGAVLLARRNLRLGRGDRRTATRLALFILLIETLRWLLALHYPSQPASHQGGIFIFTTRVGKSLFWSASLWMIYIAFEPYLRRLWPKILVSWIRLLDGRFRDPLVGRDVLVGCCLGVGVVSLLRLFQLASPWLGQSAVGPDAAALISGAPSIYFELIALHGLRHDLWAVLTLLLSALFMAFMATIGILLLRLLLRRTDLAVGTFLAGSLTIVLAPASAGLSIVWVVAGAVLLALFLGALFRFGFLSFVVGAFVDYLLRGGPLTLDPQTWYFKASILHVNAILILAACAFYVSLAGQPLFRDEIFAAET